MPISKNLHTNCQNCGTWFSLPSMRESPMPHDPIIAEQNNEKCPSCGSRIPWKFENMKTIVAKNFEFMGNFTDLICNEGDLPPQ